MLISEKKLEKNTIAERIEAFKLKKSDALT